MLVFHVILAMHEESTCCLYEYAMHVICRRRGVRAVGEGEEGALPEAVPVGGGPSEGCVRPVQTGGRVGGGTASSR